jgi:hAT family C-terminal dimerisation region
VVVPASSATAERSFSTLRRLKTYLRATMAQERLNHLAVLHVHKSRVDALELSKIKKLFISANDYRRSVFGQPLEVELPLVTLKTCA